FTPLAHSLSIILPEIVETVSKRRSSELSMRKAILCRSLPFNNPIPKATSTSKSWRCSQHLARHSQAVKSPAGAHMKAGATVNTTSGRQAICHSITGNEAMANKIKANGGNGPLGPSATKGGVPQTSPPPFFPRRYGGQRYFLSTCQF